MSNSGPIIEVSGLTKKFGGVVHIDTPIAVYVAHTSAMIKLRPILFLANGSKPPRLFRLFWNGLHVSPSPVPVTDNLRNPIAVKIAERR